MIDPHTKQQLTAAALAARQSAYAPYSKFPVGAAVLSQSGAIYTGVNVENASYGLTLCAERVAVGTAITSGEQKLLAVAIASSHAAAPCGACRQVLAEFGADMQVLFVDADAPEKTRETTLDTLLPERFSFK